MSETGKRIKERRKELGISADDLAEGLGVSRSTIFRYEKGDIEKVPAESLQKISELLNASPAYLMGWEEKPDTSTDWTSPPDLTAKDKKDIAKDLEEYRKHLSSAEGLMFDGEPATEEAVQSIIDSLEVGIEIAKKRNKEKYTPKKYRK